MIIIKRKCEFCGEQFEVKSAFSKTKYCELHREAGRAEKIREYKRRSYQRNKKRRSIESLGTINLGPHALEDPLKEEKVIKNLLPRNKVIPTYIKGTLYNYFRWFNVSNGCHEYGDPIPSGIQLTHKGATFDDYTNNAVTYWMEVKGKCPECGSNTRLKDRSRSETACKCGLILNAAPHRGFKTPDNTFKAPFQKYSHEYKELKEKIKKQKEKEAMECGSNAKNANTNSNMTPKKTSTNPQVAPNAVI